MLALRLRITASTPVSYRDLKKKNQNCTELLGRYLHLIYIYFVGDESHSSTLFILLYLVIHYCDQGDASR